MSIEFRCSRCNRLLQTGDDTVGKQAKCPECGAFTTIPAPEAAAAPDSPAAGEDPLSMPPPPPPPESGPASPFGGTSQPAAGPDPTNPYQSPGHYTTAGVPYTTPDPMAAQRVAGPATALLITGALGLVMQVFGMLGNVVQVGRFGGGGPGFQPGVPGQPMPFALGAGVILGLGLVGIILAVVVVIGALKMKRLENYGLAVAASIVALIPCTSPCCVLGLPFGIWALVVLSDGRVRAAFRN